MTPRAVVRRRAAADLAEIYDYLADRNVSAADRFADAAAADFDLLAALPGTGAPRRSRNPSLFDLRHWPIRGFRNYIVFYMPTPNGIDVVRVLHAARDTDRLLSHE